MSKPTYSTMLNEQAITVVFHEEGIIKTIGRGHPQVGLIEDGIRNRVSSRELLDLFDRAEAVRRFMQDQVTVTDGEIYYAGAKVNNLVVKRIFEFMEKGLPAEPLIRFLVRLMANPSRHSVEQLYSFLEHENLPITQDGFFLGYKGVRDNYWSCHGDRQAALLQGRMDEHGALYNAPGEVLEVERNYVQDDPNIGCHHGLHVGSYDYASSFGQRVVVVLVDPADVVSVPNDSNFQKLRACRYQVLYDCSGRLDQASVTPRSTPPAPPTPPRKPRKTRADRELRALLRQEATLLRLRENEKSYHGYSGFSRKRELDALRKRIRVRQNRMNNPA